jgi:DNA-binding NtrC family response regulator
MSAAPPVRKPVLLIDDDEVIAGSLRQYLGMQGCDVDLAVDPPSAETFMKSKRYDVVIVDPYLTGAIHDEHDALLHSISDLQPEASTIILTGYSSPELTSAAARCHSARVFEKPQSVVFLSELVMGAPRHAVSRDLLDS